MNASKRKPHRLAKFSGGSSRSDYSSDALTWYQWAEHNYSASQTLFGDANPFLWFGAAVLGHQSLEMFLKAILIGTGHRAVPGDAWGHDLLMLAKKVEKSGTQLPIELAEHLRVFDGFFNELRYPTGLSEVSGLGGFEHGALLESIAAILRPHAESAARKP